MYLQDANMFLDIVNIVLDKERAQERVSLFGRLCISKIISSCMRMTKHLHQSDQWALHREAQNRKEIFLAFIPFMLRQGGIKCQVTHWVWVTLRLHIWHLLLITSLTWQFKEECIYLSWFLVCIYFIREGVPKNKQWTYAFFPKLVLLQIFKIQGVFFPHDFQNQNETQVATNHGYFFKKLSM